MKKENRYIQFPLHLIRGLYTNKVSTINDMINFGVNYFAMNLKFSRDDVFRQLIYFLLHKRDQLTPELLMELENNDLFPKLEDIDCAGFNFNNEFLIHSKEYDIYNDAREYFNESSNLRKQAITHYKFHKAFHFFDIEWNIGIQILNTKNQTNPTGILPMINIDKLFEFRNNDKSETDIVEFVAYIALRSIIGQKQYCKTNKLLMFARMFGFASIKDQNINLLNKTQKRIFHRYQERYQFEKLMESLQVNWHLKYYSHYNRGFYISTDLNLEELVLIAEKQKRSNKNRKLKDKKKMAREKALSELYKN